MGTALRAAEETAGPLGKRQFLPKRLRPGQEGPEEGKTGPRARRAQRDKRESALAATEFRKR